MFCEKGVNGTVVVILVSNSNTVEDVYDMLGGLHNVTVPPRCIGRCINGSCLDDIPREANIYFSSLELPLQVDARHGDDCHGD